MIVQARIDEALDELDAIAPGVPLLALGQTALWDEPMKAGVALALQRRGGKRAFVAGVHDTDYFAKLPHLRGEDRQTGFVAMARNDTTTKDLWSAAAEFSALFGSETPIKKERLAKAGLKIHRIEAERPGLLDNLTEAYGWRGVVGLDEDSPVTGDMPMARVRRAIMEALNWAIDSTLSCLNGDGAAEAKSKAEDLRRFVSESCHDDRCRTLADGYESILPAIYQFTAGVSVSMETTRTSRLLRLNADTCDAPRFELLDIFLHPEIRAAACEAYNQVSKHSGLYGLERFGTGALPFDVYIPGIGRGTLRLGARGAVIQTPRPQFLSFRRAPQSSRDLAVALEEKFGPNCAVIGKAITLIGMLGREYVFVFHEGASGYVDRSAALHRKLAEILGKPFDVKPILRLKYDTWSSLTGVKAWFKLPEPLKGPFGSDDICAPSFASRWQSVGEEQTSLLEKLGEVKRPLALIEFLDQQLGGSWKTLAGEYRDLQLRQDSLLKDIEVLNRKRRDSFSVIRQLKLERVNLEIEKGRHFREAIFEKSPSETDLAMRRDFDAKIQSKIEELAAERRKMREYGKQQGELAKSSSLTSATARRRDIELEAELKRARLVSHAVTASEGLKKAGLRPSAWWFPLVSPSGQWFTQTVDSAVAYLEPLT